MKYSALVFLGGASYGGMAAVLKMAYAEGFSWPQMVVSQALFGVLIFAVALGVQMLAGKRPVRLSARQIVSLLGLGLSTCATCILYNIALTRLPVAVAVTLLFQFTWLGIVVQVITTRRRPQTAEVVAVVIILGGTVLASGLLSIQLAGLDPLGVACGLGSAVTTALFMFLSSRIGVGLPPVQRGLFVCLGALALGLVVCPWYFTSGALEAGVWTYGLALGMFALFIPVIAFGIGTPHLLPGIATIMASSELPCSIAIAVVLVNEKVDPLQVLGVLAILLGVVISQLPALPPKSSTPLEKNSENDLLQ